MTKYHREWRIHIPASVMRAGEHQASGQPQGIIQQGPVSVSSQLACLCRVPEFVYKPAGGADFLDDVKLGRPDQAGCQRSLPATSVGPPRTNLRKLWPC